MHSARQALGIPGVDFKELVLAYVADRVLNKLLDGIEGVRLPKTDGPRAIVVGQRAVERYVLRQLALARCPPELLWIGDLMNDNDVHLTPPFRSGCLKKRPCSSQPIVSPSWERGKTA